MRRMMGSTTMAATVALLAIAAVALGVAAEPLVRFEAEPFPSGNEWRAVGSADPSQPLTLHFAVRHTDAQLEALQATASRVSDPDSNSFRHYLSYEEMQEQFTPPTESINTVVAFLNEQLGLQPQESQAQAHQPLSASFDSNTHGGVRVSVLPGGWVRAEGVRVADAARMLHTQFTRFEKVIESAEQEEAADRQSDETTPDATAESIPSDQQPSMPLAGVPVDHTSSLPLVRSSTGYSLPADVAALVDFVDGVTKLPTTRFQAVISRATTAEAPAPNPYPYPYPYPYPQPPMSEPSSWPRSDLLYTVTPSFLRDLYNIPASARGSMSKANRQVVPQFLEQYYSESDLQAYLSRHGVEPRQNVSKVYGPNVPQVPGGEASLDTQLIMALAPGVLTEMWSFGGRRDNSQPPSNFNQEPFLDWLLHLAANPNPPLVHSVSYADDEKDCTEAYMRRLDVEFQKAALRGISILFAAGDDGIGSVDARTSPRTACTQSHPNFPSSSPWITSVGGTQLSLDTSDKKDEVVCSAATGGSITTGGGFSHLFPRPAYQQEQVDAYLKLGTTHAAPAPVAPPSPLHPSVVPPAQLLPPASWFNSSNRGFPDVSVLATNYEIVVGGRWVRTGGTSASAPVVAAMVSLWNERLLAAGKPPMGFVNPWLYKQAKMHGDKAFRDVTRGSNACSQNRANCCPHGFGAAQGWDASTGVGTPNFAFLQSQLEL